MPFPPVFGGIQRYSTACDPESYHPGQNEPAARRRKKHSAASRNQRTATCYFRQADDQRAAADVKSKYRRAECDSVVLLHGRLPRSKITRGGPQWRARDSSAVAMDGLHLLGRRPIALTHVFVGAPSVGTCAAFVRRLRPRQFCPVLRQSKIPASAKPKIHFRPIRAIPDALSEKREAVMETGQS